MKVYKLEFYFFCGSQWAKLNVTITAINKFQLIRVFLNETLYYNGNKTIKQLWKESEKDIIIENLKFPIISSVEV